MGDCNNSLIVDINMFKDSIPKDADRLLHFFDKKEYENVLYYAERILELTKDAIEQQKILDENIKFEWYGN